MSRDGGSGRSELLKPSNQEFNFNSIDFKPLGRNEFTGSDSNKVGSDDFENEDDDH